MNRLSGLLPLFLVASVLFLSAESNLPRNTPSRLPQASTRPAAVPPTDFVTPQAQTYNYYGTFNVIPKSTPDFWTRNHDRIDGLSAGIVALFTVALFATSYLQWKTIKHQAKIMEAQYNQSVNLINWNCSEKLGDNKLRIWAAFVNSSDYPITFSGSITVERETSNFEAEYLSPRYSKTVGFNVPMPVQDSSSSPSVDAQITYTRNQITKEQVSVIWKGKVDYSRWESDKRWHFNRTQLTTKYEIIT